MEWKIIMIKRIVAGSIQWDKKRYGNYAKKNTGMEKNNHQKNCCREYSMGCVSWGSLPPAEITWYRRMDNSQVIIIVFVIIIIIIIFDIMIIMKVIIIMKLIDNFQSGFTPMVNANEEERSRSKVGNKIINLNERFHQQQQKITRSSTK